MMEENFLQDFSRTFLPRKNREKREFRGGQKLLEIQHSKCKFYERENPQKLGFVRLVALVFIFSFYGNQEQTQALFCPLQ